MQGVGTGRLVASRYALRQRRATLGAIEVWAATDSTLGREVSVTVLPVSDAHADPLLEAARLTASVNDHRFVRVLDVGSRGEIAWVVEESLSESTSVADLLTSGPLPPEEARRIAGEVASALDVAAREQLHHLHITPHAVRRTKAGLVKIAGLATAAAVEGTPVPDSAEAGRIDALGTIGLLYATMTTRWPLRSSVPGLEAAPRVAGSVVPPSEIAVAVPPDLDAICRDTFSRSSRTVAPKTPGEVAQRLGPWSHTLVRHVAPKAPAAPPTEEIPRVRPTAGAGAAATGAAASSAAATATGAAPRNAPRKPSHREQRAHDKAAQAAEERREIAARRRDPGFLDVPEELASSTGPLEAPAPLVAAPVEREGRYAKVVLAIVAAVVLAATAFAASQIMGAVDEMNTAVTPTATRTPAPTGTPRGETTPVQDGGTAATPAPEAIAFVGARTLDPEGDGRENDGAVSRAYDGDTSTFWQSEGYKAADYQGQKSGVGIALELPEGATPSTVSVVLGEREQDASVYVSGTRSLDDATRIGEFTAATGTQEAAVPDEAREGARFVIVWVTQAMAQDDDRFRAIVSEVTAL